VTCGRAYGQEPTAAPIRVAVEHVTKRYGDPTSNRQIVAVDDVSFIVREGEFVTILGPSGCGKSSLLNMLAGLTEPSAGRILIDGSEVENRRRFFGYMFQKDLLFPWRTIVENVGLGAEVLGARKREAIERAREMLERFGLGAFADRYPSQLSGGMRQRAALIRTLLCDRDMLLLDEPLGALDALTRSLMQEWLLGIWYRERRTIVLITHDIEEAVFLSQRVLTMSARPGKIKEDITVDLTHPRTHEIVTSPQFTELKRHVMDQIYDEGVKAEAST
jgi:ABC-type nitrate/sulfonate/bicarbonate transport system ATPase subunit